MSCYEWEQGTIKIPARQWKEFITPILACQRESFNGVTVLEFNLDDDATLILDNRAKTVTWVVPENNHAKKHAREHLLAKVFFRSLANVKWTRGSGGEIVGNDEYNRDDREAGGGGNYVTDYYGPRRKSGGRRGRYGRNLRI